MDKIISMSEFKNINNNFKVPVLRKVGELRRDVVPYWRLRKPPIKLSKVKPIRKKVKKPYTPIFREPTTPLPSKRVVAKKLVRVKLPPVKLPVVKLPAVKLPVVKLPDVKLPKSKPQKITNNDPLFYANKKNIPFTVPAKTTKIVSKDKTLAEKIMVPVAIGLMTLLLKN